MCVLLLVPGGVMSAPIDRQLPPWVNPCGHPSTTDHHSDSSESSPRSILDILTSINISAMNALTHAEYFRVDFVTKTFGSDFEKHHREWVKQHYGWLPNRDEEIPKDLGDRLPSEHLNKAELDKFLVDAYRYLQTIAVGLEQVHKDMIRRKGEFTKWFREVEHKLRQVLCEVRTAIGERLPGHRIVDVSARVMPDSYRNISNDSSMVDLRDWIIFREYMNVLEFIIQLCEHFIKTAHPYQY